MKRKHFIISSIIFVSSIVSLILVFSHLLGIRHHRIKSILEIESSKSVGAIVDRFNQTYAIIDNMNYQIINNPKDKKYINNILTKYKTNPSLTDTFSWTIFSWADTSNKITVDANYGIMNPPIDLSSRDYIAFTAKNPNVFHLGKPVIGSTSKKWMIPGGVGLNDKNGNYAGSMTIGFEIDALARIIQKSLQNNNIKVTLVYDQIDLPVFYVNSKNYSSFRDQSNNDDKRTNKILTELKSSNNNQIINIKLVKDQHAYLAQKIENYPFVLVLEYDEIAIINELWSSIISRIYEILLIIFAASALMYLIYKREHEQTKIERFLKHKLHASNLRLKSLNKSVNHDLRNYITGIMGLANMVADESGAKKKSSLSSQTINQHANLIADQAKIMLKFSKSLLTDEGIENRSNNLGARKIEEDFEDIDLAALINQLIILKKPFIKEQEVSIKNDIPENLPTLKTDLIELRKILDNLIINAIKYSPKGSEVVVKSSTVDKDYLQIQIIDNGIGMMKDEIVQALTGEGKSIDKSGLDKEIDSHGIGLPIVKQAVDNLGARMEIESEKGKGTKVKLWFKNKAAEKQSFAPEKIQNSSMNGKNIILADDNKVVSIATKYQLAALGYNVLIANNGDEVIDILENNDCDLILMDTNMVDLGDGLKTTKLIREGLMFKNFKTIPIIAFSADYDVASQELALKSGSSVCMEKPFDEKNFLTIIKGFEVQTP